ncbi:uncharacterized protein LOC115430449 isoform X3 [Sphaeramia orbicularis]|uniref:uncharacterized protein LOC115430449 isoform X3 n=1 Tax=Sphaeramia orbicularis TaxID=375764 RepID=UPI00117F3CE7|nr:uncharacterized protein KIAA1958 homolog isoform X3 [Sphaeramia orbicularis]
MEKTNSEPLKLSGAERQKLYRARRNADPERREKYLKKEKERWKRDIQTGRKKLIGQKTKTEQHLQRMKWKEAKRRSSKRTALRMSYGTTMCPDDDPDHKEEEEALREVSVPFELDQTLSDSLSIVSLCKLVRWAHSHGTICSLIPDLQQLTHGGTASTQATGPHGADVPVAVWGCSAGHAYYWTFSDHGNVCGGLANTRQGQVSVRGSSDFSGVEPTSELMEFMCQRSLDATGDLSATDDSEDFETPGVKVKEIKEELLENNSYLNTNRRQSEADAADLTQDCKTLKTHSVFTHTQASNSQHNNPQDRNSPINQAPPVYT